MDRNEIITMKSQFDAIAHHDDELGIEFWYAKSISATKTQRCRQQRQENNYQRGVLS